MTARVLTGSKQEIAQQVASLEGEVRQVIAFVEEPHSATSINPVGSVEELFAEMEPYTVRVGDADDSRAGIYTRMAGE
jgi:hypothetical protein